MLNEKCCPLKWKKKDEVLRSITETYLKKGISKRRTSIKQNRDCFLKII